MERALNRKTFNAIREAMRSMWNFGLSFSTATMLRIMEVRKKAALAHNRMLHII
jgi:hypothetical protein